MLYVRILTSPESCCIAFSQSALHFPNVSNPFWEIVTIYFGKQGLF